MIRWLIVVFLALVLINGLTPWLQRLGLGKLQDFISGCSGASEVYPAGQHTVLLSFVLSLIVKWL